MLSDVLATRSPLTLIKRVNPLLRSYMCFQKDGGAPKSRLKSLVEYIRFCQYVVGFDGISDELLSRRVLGASSSIAQGPSSQASPLLVVQLRCPHKIFEDLEEENWDRLAAGAILMAIYSRARWNDLQHAIELFLDEVFGVPFFLEARVTHHKTRRANTWAGTAMPLVAPAVGVTADNGLHRGGS